MIQIVALQETTKILPWVCCSWVSIITDIEKLEISTAVYPPSEVFQAYSVKFLTEYAWNTFPEQIICFSFPIITLFDS